MYRLYGSWTGWMHNWLNDCAQRTRINGLQSLLWGRSLMQGHRTLAAALSEHRGLSHPYLVQSPCESLWSYIWTGRARLWRWTPVIYSSASDQRWKTNLFCWRRGGCQNQLTMLQALWLRPKWELVCCCWWNGLLWIHINPVLGGLQGCCLFLQRPKLMSECPRRKKMVRTRYSLSSVQSLSHVRLFVTPWLQHTRLPCPSPTPRVYSNSCPLHRWCHPTILSSVVPFSSHLWSFPASGSFQMSQLFALGG